MSTAVTTMTMDMMKGWVEELVRKNRDLEEEVKNLKLQLQNSGPGQEVLQSQIHSLQQDNMALRLQYLGVSTKLLQAEMKLNSCTETEENYGNRCPPGGQLDPPPKKRRQVQLVRYHSESDASSDQEDRIPVSLSGTVNPLQIEEILRHIMSYVKPTELLKCRQVCKLWNNASEKYFQERMTFYIAKDDLFSHKSFMDQAAKSFPMFQKLKLVLDRDSRPGNKKIVRELFTNYGKTLKYLNLVYGGTGWGETHWHVNDFRDIILNSLDEIRELQITLSCWFIRAERIYYPHHVKKYFENLTDLRLGIDCGEHSCNDTRNRTTQVFADLLRMAPNLKTLHWRSNRYGTPNFVQSLLEVNPSKLKNLFFYSQLSEGCVTSIANSQLKLEQLYLVDYKSFELSLVTSPGRSWKSEVTPKKPFYTNERNQSIVSDSEMSIYLELELVIATAMARSAENRDAPFCTKLLQVFTAALAAKLG